MTVNAANMTGEHDTSVVINAPQGQQAMVVLAEGADAYSLANDGASKSFTVSKHGIATPLISIESPTITGYDTKGEDENMQGNKMSRSSEPYKQWSAVMNINAAEGQAAKLSLHEGDNSYSLAHDGSTGKFVVARSGIDTPVLTIENDFVIGNDASGEEGAQSGDMEWLMAHQKSWSSTMTLNSGKDQE